MSFIQNPSPEVCKLYYFIINFKKLKRIDTTFFQNTINSNCIPTYLEQTHYLL